jgi:hypothetical protein
VLGLADRIDASGALNAARKQQREATEARALPVSVPGRSAEPVTRRP